MIFVMVVLGGTTRLTRSGLSIVEWNLVTGVLPPLDETAWQALFEKYRHSPEYLTVNTGMALEGFKNIFWLEYLHRLWGRLIFFVALIPLIYFLWRGVERPLALKLIGVPILIALNGALGWLMVKSGLVDLPRVSPYRLTAHLGLATVAYGYTLWIALGLLYPNVAKNISVPLRRFGWAVTTLVFSTLLAGGFVAGNKAGFAFNTWPLMYGRLVPEGLFTLQPWWTNLFENIATVQFNHRMLAYAVLVAVAAYCWLALREKLIARRQQAFALLPVVVLAQAILGIATLLLAVPILLGAAHQAGALVVFTVALYLNHALRKHG